MYKEAEKIINNGLSTFSRFLLGFFSGLFGIVMIVVAPPSDKAFYFYLFGAFCILICLACIFKGKVRKFIGSSIGLCIFLLSLGYLINELFNGELTSGGRNEPSIINSIKFLIFFGIPGIAYTIKARFGISKK